VNARSKHLPAKERRAVTVEAVIELAGTINPADITTSAIAEHMHLTQGALFRHFPTKAAIWQAVMSWVADRLLARIDRAALGVESPIKAMQAMFLSHIEFVADHPGVPRMLLGELQRAEQTPAKQMAQTMFQRVCITTLSAARPVARWRLIWTARRQRHCSSAQFRDWSFNP